MLGNGKAYTRLFCEFDLSTHKPQNHLVRGIDRFLDLRELHADLPRCTVTSPAIDRPGTHHPHARHRLRDGDKVGAPLYQ